MSRYLLAAEADKIQDFIFRAAKLREVVGGSRLLARFCDEGVNALMVHKNHTAANPEKIISDGGAFRFVFDTKEQAEAFGQDLAELYRRCAGGILTVAEPVEYDESEFKKCNDQAQEKLREAKSVGDKGATAVHLPYIAFCASCGSAIATEHQRKILSEQSERANYLCSDCRNKTEEKYDRDKLFLGAFHNALKKHLQDKNKLLPLPSLHKRDWVDVISKADPRNYVAYLVADGNGMGKLFSECDTPEKLRNLSRGLTDALRESLALPCATMLKKQEAIQGLNALPVIPLILGGDDLFALLPAPFAIDFTKHFCQTYEEKLEAALTKPEINLTTGKKPTVAAAVVICKSNYPHTLAHQRGEAALKEAKEMARRIEVHSGKRVSVLNFVVVTGNQVIADEGEETRQECRKSLRPYFVSEDAPEGWGTKIRPLLEARFALRELPGKRRAEFKRLYDDLPEDKKKPSEEGKFRSDWKPDFDELIKRLGVRDDSVQPDNSFNQDDDLPIALRKSLKLLGANKKAVCYLKEVTRGMSEYWHGHGLPDLLEVWDFAYKIDKASGDYEED